MKLRIGILAVVTLLMASMAVATVMACTTLTPGYWKNHPGAWPAGSLPTMTIGDVSYTQAQLIGWLNTPPKGDASIILMQKVIAAKLSMLADPNTPGYAHWDDPALFGGTAFSVKVAQANAWLVLHPPGSAPTGAARDEGLALASWIDYWLNYWDEFVPP